MKISREARNKYQFQDFSFSDKGNINFEGDIYSVRLFVQKINQKRDLINYPELAIKPAFFNGMALLTEIYGYIFNIYKEENDLSTLSEDLYNHLKNKFDQEKIANTLSQFIEEFPPESVYKNISDIPSFLKDESNRISIIDEVILLWLENDNPSFSPYLDLYDDEKLEKETIYSELLEEIEIFFESKPKFGPKNQNIIDMLKDPSSTYPHSIREQLEYLYENWGGLIGTYSQKILLALDLIREEEMLRGLGPGKSKAYEYDLMELENFTPDKEWMPKVVMMAKNVYVWLDQLSKKYKRPITKINEIPDEELDQLNNWGFNALWLIGLWERSQASKTIKRWCGNPEAEASAYSLFDYQIAYDLGGYNALMDLKRRASSRGIRLASDMVPNHTGIVSKWMFEHPEWFISLPYPPFPSYSYSGESLSGTPDIGIYIEDKYFNRSDAAVTFKYADFKKNETKYIYHGNDGTSFPWNDTAQLNYLNPAVREAVIQTILNVSRMFSIIRFDAAMTLTRKHYHRLWFPEPGTGGAIPSRAEHGISKEDFYKAMPNEFWREVVDRIKAENPDTLLLAEAFWLLEGFFVRTLGMHRVYNSAFMNMLRDEDNAIYRLVMKNTLEFDPEILKRFVNFMNNPDEETAIKQFGSGEKYFGICVMMVTLPGLPMFGHGQLEGFHEKYGMEYRKAYWDERLDEGLLEYHKKTIFPILKKRYLFAEVFNFLLYDFWSGNIVNEDVFAYSNRRDGERALVIYNNKYAETKGFIKNSVGFALKEQDEKTLVQKTLSEGLSLPKDGYCIFKDYMTGLEYLRRNSDILNDGLYIELHAYQVFAFMDFRIVQDNEFFHYAHLFEFLGGKGVSNINDVLSQLVYRPLHEPLESIINKENFRGLLDKNERQSIILGLEEKLITFLTEVKKYSNGVAELNPIKNEIMHKLMDALDIKDKLNKLNIHKDIIKWVEVVSPKDLYEWSILLSWLIIHPLGKVVSSTAFELRTRSWLDEWQISKLINLTINSLIDNGKDFLSLIKVLINQQSWYKEHKEFQAKGILQSILKDPEVQQYININRYQNVLWFRSESFDELIKWISFIGTLGIIYDDDNVENNLQTIKDIQIKWQSAAKESKFQVEKLMEFLS